MANGGWRECANWLTRCGAIRSDHKVNWPESTIDDLAHTLRDGVILCNLLNILEPGCLGTKDINQKPQMAQVMIYKFHFTLKTFSNLFIKFHIYTQCL